MGADLEGYPFAIQRLRLTLLNRIERRPVAAAPTCHSDVCVMLRQIEVGEKVK